MNLIFLDYITFWWCYLYKTASANICCLLKHCGLARWQHQVAKHSAFTTYIYPWAFIIIYEKKNHPWWICRVKTWCVLQIRRMCFVSSAISVSRRLHNAKQQAMVCMPQSGSWHSYGVAQHTSMFHHFKLQEFPV